MAMPEAEQRSFARSEARKLNWILTGLGVLVPAVMAIAGYSLRMESRVSTLEQAAISRMERVEAIAARQETLEGRRDTDREAVIRIGAKLDAQGQSIKRIEASVSELVRYLRGFRPPQGPEGDR